MSDANFCGECGADSSGACTCSEECEECGGDGYIEVYAGREPDDTDERECPKCHGAGHVTDDGPDFDPDDRPLPTEDRSGLKESPL